MYSQVNMLHLMSWSKSEVSRILAIPVTRGCDLFSVVSLTLVRGKMKAVLKVLEFRKIPIVC